MAAAFNSAKTKIGSLHGETKKATTIFDLLGNKVKELWTYMAARIGVDEAIQAIRTGIQYVRDIDSALTELKKVTNETDASYDRFLQNMSKTADVVGSTVSELTTMAAEWARLGYSMEESAKLAESTAILLNVSEFKDATAASEALISTMQAFQYTADQSMHVVDILNEVGKLLPVDNYIG
jgi:TP901 family phage tail tape measure protein